MSLLGLSFSIDTSPFNFGHSFPSTTPEATNSSMSIDCGASPFCLITSPPLLIQRYIFIPSKIEVTEPYLSDLPLEIASYLDKLNIDLDRLQAFQSVLALIKNPLYEEPSTRGNLIRIAVSMFIQELEDTFLRELPLDSDAFNSSEFCKALEVNVMQSPKAKYDEFISLFPNSELIPTDSPAEIYFISEFILLVCRLDVAFPSIDNWNVRDARSKLQELWNTFREDQKQAIHKYMQTTKVRGIAEGTMRMIDFGRLKASSSLGRERGSIPLNIPASNYSSIEE